MPVEVTSSIAMNQLDSRHSIALSTGRIHHLRDIGQIIQDGSGLGMGKSTFLGIPLWIGRVIDGMV